MTLSTLDPTPQLEERRAIRDNLRDAAAGLGVAFPEEHLVGGTSIAALRRSGRPGADVDTTGVITLVQNRDGALVWRAGAATAGRVVGRRGRRAALEPGGNVVTQLRFEKLLPNQVGQFLETLDAKLTPNQGLRRFDWDKEAFTPVKRPEGKRRALLIIHGTFSNGDAIIDHFRALEQAKGFLRWARGQYDEVLSFDHPTVGVSPVLNALDLARLFRGVQASVDVICHSRGGLVARWWLECFEGASAGPRRVVLVGSPLGGTSLASPGRLRAGLDFITNVGHVLETIGEYASAGVPFLAVGVGLMKVVTSITSVVAHLPLLDAVIAMVPGLHGQSRIENGPELNRLRANDQPLPPYHAITSDFQPDPVGWKFWRYFVNIGDRLSKAATNLVFTEENDLVVDTASMTELVENTGIASVLKFGKNPTVHHTNYFRQPQTVDQLREWFAAPAAR